MSELFDCRDAFSQTLEELAANDPRVVAVVNDSVSSTKLKNFSKRFPNRFINVGIAEQNMVGVGAGLANGGKLPFVCAASCFMTARAMEQIKVDLGYSRYNVKLCGMSSGMAYGELGPTHHSIEDLAWMRAIPNLTVVVPADPIETRSAMEAIARYEGPVFFRLSRMPVPNIHPRDYRYEIGKSVRLREGDDITLVANGVLVSRALEAADVLERSGISARVINMSTVKPLDRAAIIDAATTTGGIVTVEEHSIYGGLGGAIAEVVATTCPVRMRILGVPGEFAPTGTEEFLLEHFGLTAQGIAKAAVELLEVVRRV
ncbi:MAG: transketolase family protein [Candidatus Acidiferrales bacterium]